MAAKRGLGRGLDALIQDVPVGPALSDVGSPDAAAQGVVSVNVDSIRQNPYQPRDVFEPEALQDLVRSIQAHGVLQPLLLRRSGEEYELVAGERRLRAARQAGLESVPSIVKDVSDKDALALGLIENLQREDLNVMEEAGGYQRLADQFGLTQEEISQHVGKARATVANVLRLLELPDDVREMIVGGALSAGHAKVLLGVPMDEEKCALARRVAKEGLSVRSLERVVARLTGVPRKPRAARVDMDTDHLRYLTDKLHRRFGTNVRILPSRTLANGKKSKGTIELDFYSNEDLNRILDILGMIEDEHGAD